MARKRQTRNLEIPGSMLAHRPGMTIWKDSGLLRRSSAKLLRNFVAGSSQ